MVEAGNGDNAFQSQNGTSLLIAPTRAGLFCEFSFFDVSWGDQFRCRISPRRAAPIALPITLVTAGATGG
jgi:hypothetical protein